jgi:hypothetical protein
MQPELICSPWVKSSYSDTGANCVEIARTVSGGIAVRDSKNPSGPVLMVGAAEWEEFVQRVKR